MTAMKRAALLVLMLAFALCPLAGALAGDCSSVSCVPSGPDGNGMYTVSVQLEDGGALAMIQFALRYDPEKLECVSAAGGALLNGLEEATINADIPGKIYFVWDSLEPLEADGELMRLEMRLRTDEPAALSFDFEEDCIFARDDFSQIELFTNDAAVGETGTEETTGETAPAEEPAADETEAGGSWVLYAAAGAAIVLLAGAGFLAFWNKPRGKH